MKNSLCSRTNARATVTGPPQFSTVYGYAEPVVAAATRYGWWIGALGVAAGYAVTR